MEAALGLGGTRHVLLWLWVWVSVGVPFPLASAWAWAPNGTARAADYRWSTGNMTFQLHADMSAFGGGGWSSDNTTVTQGSSVCGPTMSGGLGGWFVFLDNLRLLKEQPPEVSWCGQIATFNAKHLLLQQRQVWHVACGLTAAPLPPAPCAYSPLSSSCCA